MSRVAKAPVSIPSSVKFSLENNVMTIEGPKGKLSQHVNHLVSVSLDAEYKDKLIFRPINTDPNGWAQAGTVRAICNNMITGVTQGFVRGLELVGVGYRAQAAGASITLSLGYSHPINYDLPKGITASTPNNTTIELSGIDKQLLGQVASEIRSFRPPEPYKGKGVKYAGEMINRKEAKKK